MTNAEARCNNSLRPRKPEGSLGRTAQDVHLDSHTAPDLWWTLLDQRTSFNTLDNYGAIKFPPNQKRERTTVKKRLKGHGPGHTQYTRLQEYTPFSVLLLNCHRSTHLSACCYWTVTRVHTFQRVVIELTPEYTPFNVLLWLSGLDQSQKQDAQGPITTCVWPQGPVTT